jgi:hypothetical protein
MVMGVQRSGTTVLFRSLAGDPSLTSFHESVDDPIYYLYRLRPVEETAPILNAALGAILLKPITETFYRSLEDLRAEYAEYSLRFVWIYRNPIDVLLSMSRKGWLSFELEGERGAENWVTRNRLALQFQTEHPAEIAIVRYEDLICDSQVFDLLCGSLAISGRPIFKDRGNGRRDLPPPLQEAIQKVTRQTLQALDAARTFKPRSFRQLRAVAAAKFSRPATRRLPADAPMPPRHWTSEVMTASPKPASDLDGLSFWLDSERLSPINNRILELKEQGPFSLRAVADGQAPFCIPFLNGRSALFFPTSKAPERLRGDRGILRFTGPIMEAGSLICGPFSLVTLIKPHRPKKTCPSQDRMVALRVRSDGQGAEFTLEWDRQVRAIRGTLKIGDQSASVVTERESHPNQQWRIIHFQIEEECNPQLLISADGVQSIAPMARLAASVRSRLQSDWVIELGGSETDPKTLFYGAIAEVIMVARHLTRTEQIAVASYLRQKYRL